MDHHDIQHNRLKWLVGFFAIILLIYIGLLYNLQVVNHDYYAAQAVYSIAREEYVEASRGLITDRNGKTLVANRSAYALTFDASLLSPDEDENSAILRLVQLCETQDQDWANNLPITKQSPFFYTVNNMSDLQKGRFLTYLKNLDPAREALEKYLQSNPDILELNVDPISLDAAEDSITNLDLDMVDSLETRHLTESLLRSAGIDPQTLLDWMREALDIPEEFSDNETRLIASVKYELRLRKLANYTAYVLVEDVDTELISIISDGNYAGAKITTSALREYTTPYASHILGYVGRMQAEDYAALKDQGYGLNDWLGRDGAEAAFEQYLKGKDGRRVISTDNEGRITGEFYSVDPQPGDTVELTIDLDLQAVVEEALAETVQHMNATDKKPENAASRGAGAAVIKVGTGEVLSLASYPTYDLATFRQTENYSIINADPARPMFNRATQGTYAPGSTLKPLTSVAALEEGLITPTEKILSPRTWYYPGYSASYANCWYGGSHGRINVSEAITVSCNYFFAEMGYRLGMDTFNEYLSAFGLGESTGIEISENTGVQPENNQGENQAPWAAFGQSNQLYSPLQLANYTATLVSGGYHYDAHLLKAVKSHDNAEIVALGASEPDHVVPISDSTLDAVKVGMHNLTKGSLSPYFSQCIVSAGAKTGTAQVSAETTNNGVFICFAPYEKPEIAVAIVIEKGGSGSALASTAVKILNAYFAPEDIGTSIIGENQLLQ